MRDLIHALHAHLMSRPGTRSLALLCLAFLGFNLWATDILNANYAASGFPVPYYEAQLSFSPEAIKGWYATLVQDDQLQRYITTQHIDSLFIVSTLLLHGGVLALVARLFKPGSTGRRVMVTAALRSAIAPMADQMENLVSYVMLADPAGFAPALAYVYSSFAALKFVMFVLAYGALTVGVLVAAVQRLRRRVVTAGVRCTSAST